MPMDTTDYDRIQTIVDKAFHRIETQVSLMMPKDESVTRHLAASDRIAQVEKRVNDIQVSVSELTRWSMGEHEKIRKSSGDRIDKLEDTVNKRFDSVETSVDGINKNISDARATTLRYIISVIVSFLLGGGIISIIEYARVFK